VNIRLSELLAEPVETRISEFPTVGAIIGNAPTSPIPANRASLPKSNPTRVGVSQDTCRAPPPASPEHHLTHQLLDSSPLKRPDQAFQLQQTTATCSLDTIQQDMERLPNGKRRLAVQLRLPTHPSWIWKVLTDYDNLHRFIPNLEHSRVLWRRERLVGVEQVGSQLFCGLRFSARVCLELTEESEAGRLPFRMTQGDFRCFEGEWRVGADATSSWLFYSLLVQGKPGMPIGLIEQRLQQDLANNLRGVQQEAQHRQSQALD
jgi:ribosome-associated toxin RatA of RatAB toxin-antitoxin module